MQFQFSTATEIVFGRGFAKKLAELVRPFGSRALLVTGKDQRRALGIAELLQATRVRVATFAIEGEPTVDRVREGARMANGCDFLIGFGGGGAIDGAKAIAALAPNSGEPLDYLEVVGRGQALEVAPLPFIAIPTTAGTGAEVTRNAVLGSTEHGIKASLRGPRMLAKLAIVDADLTLDLPPQITASTGLDTLTQLIEPYTSSRANAFTDLFCLEGLRRVTVSIRKVFRDGHDFAARESMSFASLLSGLALANAGLGAVHGFAAPLGGRLHAPHGALCAAVLPHAIHVNLRALRERAPESEVIERYRTVARILTGMPNAEPEDAVRWIGNLSEEFAISRLRAFGLVRAQIPALIDEAARASSMKANPIALTRDELTEIAERSL